MSSTRLNVIGSAYEGFIKHAAEVVEYSKAAIAPEEFAMVNISLSSVVLGWLRSQEMRAMKGESEGGSVELVSE